MFTTKSIRVTIKLRIGEFSDGKDTVIIEGLPVSVSINKVGGEVMNRANVSIQGLKLDTVKQLTALTFRRLDMYRNLIQVDAGNQGTALSTVFVGEIATATPKIQGAELVLDIEALTGSFAQLLPTPPTSVQGETTIEELMSQFAKEAEYSFKNNGVSGSVKNCVFIGSPITKARTLARQVDIDLLIDDNTITIQPFDAPKDGEIPLISKSSGMLGYPSYGNKGVVVKTVYDTRLKVGHWFKLDSILPLATNEWQIIKVEHKLEAYNPKGGAWETTVTGMRYTYD